MTSLDVLWVAVALSVLLVAVGLFLALVELRNFLRESRKSVDITNAELPDLLRNITETTEEIKGAAANVKTVAGGMASVSTAISSLSQKARGGWFGAGLTAGIELVKNLFKRRKK